jgi:hypothetical protein
MPTPPINMLLPAARRPFMLAKFAELAVDGALWLVRESQKSIANGAAVFDPDPNTIFDTRDRPAAAQELRDLTDEQRTDVFIAGFRNMPHTGPQNQFELLLARDPAALLKAFAARWNAVANE